MSEAENTNPYISDSLRMLLNVVAQNLLSQSDIQIIKGEKGIGKSTFCRQLKSELTKKAQTFIINGHNQLHANDVFKTMLLSYQQKPEASLKACLISLAHYLKASIKSTGSVVIIIDDAHLIPDTHLEYILQSLEALIEILKRNLKILLVGEPNIEGRLAKYNLEEVKQGKVHSSPIRPVTKQGYIKFLTHCGYDLTTVEPLLANKNKLKKLHQQSAGIPANIIVNFAQLTEPKQDYLAIVKQKFLKIDHKLKILMGAFLIIFLILFISSLGSESKNNQTLLGTETILNIDGGFYTIQLLAVSDQNLLIEFSQKYPTIGDLYFYKRSVSETLDLYILLLGKYPFKEAALDAINAMPEDLKIGKPWIRKFADIKLDIKP